MKCVDDKRTHEDGGYKYVHTLAVEEKKTERTAKKNVQVRRKADVSEPLMFGNSSLVTCKKTQHFKKQSNALVVVMNITASDGGTYTVQVMKEMTVTFVIITSMHILK
jgi:hypothetical protein